MDSGGFLLVAFITVALVPVSILFFVKVVRALFSKEARNDILGRPIMHLLWMLGAIYCCACIWRFFA